MMTKIEVAEWMPPRFARRAEHFYGEHKRVREGITAWETGNLEWFGSLSKASCDSSIHNYECGSLELQAIYQAMLTTDGIYGGRFSGAGFKGACIALGKKDHLLMLDCESNEYRLIPKAANMPDFELGIFSSVLTRIQVSSCYGLHVTECKTVDWIVQAYDNMPP